MRGHDLTNRVARLFAAVAGMLGASTTTAVLTGTDTASAVTPDALAALWEKGSNVASSGTVSLGEGGFFHITGTTTITDIDFATAKDGRTAWVIFDGALTLTHNATTLILPGGANITTAAGDRACFVQDNGDNVYCVDYVKADGTPVVAPASGGLTLLDTLTTTSGTTQSSSQIASTYRGLFLELDGVSPAANQDLQIALSSTNGSAYGTAFVLTSAATSGATITGVIRLDNIRLTTTSGKVMSALVRNNVADATITAQHQMMSTDTSAACDKIRFNWSGGTTFDAGTIRIYGVK